MQIIVNGAPYETEAKTLAELCAALGYGATPIATAVNLDFVPSAARRDTILRAGDKVEILTPHQGG